jgi:hypothetical protein
MHMHVHSKPAAVPRRTAIQAFVSAVRRMVRAALRPGGIMGTAYRADLHLL